MFGFIRRAFRAGNLGTLGNYSRCLVDPVGCPSEEYAFQKLSRIGHAPRAKRCKSPGLRVVWR